MPVRIKPRFIVFFILIIIIATIFVLIRKKDSYFYYDFFEHNMQASKEFDKFLFLDDCMVQPEIDYSASISGWQPPPQDESGTPASFYVESVGKRSVIALHLKEKRDTRLILKLKTGAGIGSIRLELELNGKPVGNINIGRTKSLYIVTLPGDKAKKGSNYLAFINSSATRKRGSFLLDWFSYNNYQLEQRIKRGWSYVQTLAAPPGKKFSYKIEIPRGATLDFMFSLLHLNFSNEKNNVRCTFIVELIRDKRSEQLFKFTLKKEDPKSLRWRNKTINLSAYAGEDCEIVFRTESNAEYSNGMPDIVPLWGAPVLYGGRTSDDLPKVLLISIDTLRADHLGCYGYDRETSPNIDALAADGILFENHYSSSSWTLPSHLSMLSGTCPSRHQNMHPQKRPDRDISMLPELLRAYGYYNYAYATWIYVSPVFGLDTGFNNFEYSSGSPSSQLVQRVLYRLRKNPDIRGFYFLHFIDPHFSYLPPPEYRNIWDKGYSGKLSGARGGKWRFFSGFKREDLNDEDLNHVVSLYDGEILFTDTSLGTLFNELKKLKLYDDMMIILTSDHGEEFLDHNGWMHSWTLYQEITHVPLIIKLPGNRFAGKRIKGPVSQVDVLPTILGYLGIDAPKNIDGMNLIPLIKGDISITKRIIASETFQELKPKFSFIADGHKYIYNMPVIDGDVKTPEMEELYDLASDPAERNNISGINSALIRSFRAFKKTYLDLMKPFYLIRTRSGAEKLDDKTRQLLRSLGYIIN